MKSNFSKDRVVYVTGRGRTCPECHRSVERCGCEPARSSANSDGIVRVSRETKGRKGKGVTLVKGLALDQATLAKMGKTLKTMCGSGGTVKEGVIEIQGDHVVRVIDHLKKQGLTVKRAGG